MRILLLLTFIALSPADIFANDKETIRPENAVAYAGEKATVEFRVNAASLLDRDDPICFLNSMKNYRSEDNFTAVIFSEGLKKFQQAGIKDPAAKFKDRIIQVTGEIGLRQGKAQIIVEYVGQIEVVEETKKK